MSALQNTQAFFDRYAPSWDYHTKPEKRGQMQAIFNEIEAGIRNPLLDLGCGNGILYSILPKSVRLTELDLSLQMLRRVKEHHAGRKPELLQADAHALPLCSVSYKTVVCFQSFPHFNRPEQVIDEVYRVLFRNGVWIILHLMDHERLNALHRKAGKEVAGDVLPAASELAGQIARQGFDILKCREEKELYLICARKR